MRRSPILAALLAAIAVGAHAQDDAAARSLAASCASCHGTDGRSASKEVASLAGMPKELLVERMNEFKNDKRPSTVMQQLARGYTGRQIQLIAAYFAAQKR